jgi:hypothetical protein
LNRRLAFTKSLGHGEGRGLALRIRRDLGDLRAAARRDRDLAERDFGSMQGDARCRFSQGDADGFTAAEGFLREIRFECERVVLGDDGSGKPLGGRRRCHRQQDGQ